jgi:hypothetical protein
VKLAARPIRDAWLRARLAIGFGTMWVALRLADVARWICPDEATARRLTGRVAP